MTSKNSVVLKTKHTKKMAKSTQKLSKILIVNATATGDIPLKSTSKTTSRHLKHLYQPHLMPMARNPYSTSSLAKTDWTN